MSALPSAAIFEEYLNEQLINCLNIQTNVIQNVSQYSQYISLQLFEIKNNVETLANRVMTLQQQSYVQIRLPPPPPPSDPLFFLQPAFQVSPPLSKSFFSNISEFKTEPAPFSFSSTTNEQPSRSAPFVFGPLNSNNIIHPDDDVEDADDPYEPTISFKPIVKLFPVEVKTGEEDENILFCERAKLYRFDSPTNQMKERGIGEMKILQHKTTNLCRVLMRREQVFKVCANHKITSQLELKAHQGSDKAFVWSVIDYADGEAKHETLCVKFKTSEQAKKFAKIFNESKNIASDLPSIEKISLNDDDIIIIGEIRPTVEQIERARKLQLPLTFYLYENKEPCKGCRGCTDDSSLNEIRFGNQMDSYLSTFPSGFFPNSSPPSLMSMVPTWLSDGVDSFSQLNHMPSSPKDYRMIIKAKRSLPSNRMPPPPSSSSLSSHSDYEQTSLAVDRDDDATAAKNHQKKSRNFSAYTTEPLSLNDYTSKMAQNILDQVKQELYKQIQIVTKTEDDKNKPSTSTNISGFSFTNFDNTTTPTTAFQFSTPISSNTTNTSSTFIFGNTPKLSFSDLVKQSSDNHLTLTDTEQRMFPGHGSLIFGTNTTDDDVDDSYESTISFKPIVKLFPVEVKTGEEDENILFCERAKLYRFDSPTNQMKERGIGEMKILQHKTTNLCRVLMRREQVFKVCANHKITSQLELKAHQGSDKAFVWSVIDYADGEAKHETLCVKFKTSDIAKRFFQQFNDAKVQQ